MTLSSEIGFGVDIHASGGEAYTLAKINPAEKIISLINWIRGKNEKKNICA